MNNRALVSLMRNRWDYEFSREESRIISLNKLAIPGGKELCHTYVCIFNAYHSAWHKAWNRKTFHIYSRKSYSQLTKLNNSQDAANGVSRDC